MKSALVMAAAVLGGLSYRVLRRDEYIAEVVTNLRWRGLCALYDGVEVAVKNANDYNEQYNVHTSQGFVRWGAGAYISTLPAGVVLRKVRRPFKSARTKWREAFAGARS